MNVRRFYEANGRLPSKKAKDPTEKTLAIFIHNMKQAAKGKGKSVLRPGTREILQSIGSDVIALNA